MKTTAMIHEPYTVDTLAALLGCDPDTAAERLNSGDLPGLKFGRGWIIPAEALHARLNEKAIQEAAARRKALEPAAPPPGSVRLMPADTQHDSTSGLNFSLKTAKKALCSKRRVPPVLDDIGNPYRGRA